VFPLISLFRKKNKTNNELGSEEKGLTSVVLLVLMDDVGAEI